MKLRNTAFRAILIATAIILASGRFLLLPSAEDIFPLLISIGTLLTATALAVISHRNLTGSLEGKSAFLICAGILISVQLTGGGGSIFYSAYLLFLMWVSLPSVGGGASEFGILIGFTEAFALLNSTLWTGSGSILPRLLPLLLPSLRALLTPFIFGLVADWLSEKESFVVDGGKSAQETRSNSKGRSASGEDLSEALLPILQRTAESRTTCLFLEHEDGSFWLEGFCSKDDSLISKLVLPGNHRLPRLIRSSAEPVLIMAGSHEERKELAPYRLRIPSEERSFWILLCPIGNADDPLGFILQDFTEDKPSSESIQNLRCASEALGRCSSRGEESRPQTIDGSWMAKLVAASSEDTLDRSVQGVAGILSQLISGATISIADVDSKSAKITIWVSRGPLAKLRRKRISSSSEGLAGWIVKNGIPCKRSRMKHGVQSVSSFSGEEQLQVKVGSCLGVPVLRGNNVLGVIIAEHEDDDAFTKYHENLLLAASGLLSMTEELAEYRNSMSSISGRDILTGLPGIAMFEDHLHQMIKKVQSYGWSIGVLVADIDGFDKINRDNSYRDGDTILKEAAIRFADCFSDDIYISRTGPDSFSACIPKAGRAEMEALCQRVADTLSWDCLTKSSSSSVRVTVSVGGCYTHINRKVLLLTGIAGNLVSEASMEAPGSCKVRKVGISDPT